MIPVFMQIDDLVGPVPLQEPRLFWPWVLGGALLLVMAVWIVSRLIVRAGRQERLLPRSERLLQLSRRPAVRPPSEEHAQLFAGELAVALRKALSVIDGRDCSRLTIAELHNGASTGPAGQNRANLMAMLEDIDSRRFSGIPLSAGEQNTLLSAFMEEAGNAAQRMAEAERQSRKRGT